ncbi:glycosyltransferase [Planococcus sp. APC 4015]|nr:glycosyltransferase [Planococcus sp. APC 4015]
MSDVVVAIPSFRRPDQLAGLLDALADQVAPVGARIVVIDNDPEGSAAAVAVARSVTHVIEPARGLAAVRNRALDEAADASAIIFIDDDELPAEDWLTTLVGRWRDSGAAAVSGRVETVFPEGFRDAWITDGGFFRRVRFDDGAHQAAAATNNLLLDLDFVRRHGLRFDEEFGLSGGEDIFFTKQLVRAGGTIVSCPDALVHDVVDPTRLNRRWVLRRAYRVGMTAVQTDLGLGGGLSVRARALVGGAARVVIGGARWVVGEVTRSTSHSARGARAAWRGAGMVMGALGRRYQEYALR